MRGLTGRPLALSLLALSLLLALIAAGLVGWALLQPLRVPGSEPLLVTVLPGDTPGRVLDRLAQEDRLDLPRVLRLWARLRGGTMNVGEYEIPGGTAALDVIDQLLAGRAARRSFTIIEGWNIHQLRAALVQEERLLQQAAGLDDKALMARLGMAGRHPEGWFAPDTYFYAPRATSDLDLLQRALVAQQRRLDAAWTDRAPELPYRSPYELLVMASIVEKETGQAAERPDIAGVFIRRMGIGMRLQTDPTVIYGLGADWNGNLTRAHLRQPTPYNTYVIDGLPPTPIAMPGAAALAAAAHPAPGKALYFVGRGDGTHQFSATLAEHNEAVRQYQLQRRENYRSAPQQQ